MTDQNPSWTQAPDVHLHQPLELTRVVYPLALVGEPVACQRCGRKWLGVESGGYVAEVEGPADQCCTAMIVHLNGHDR